ncbi:hypothetical protein MMC28_010392 [Mycoblastus sanguinarius]|nr:hypothetical protein [Mycoblastus sanguinarius]
MMRQIDERSDQAALASMQNHNVQTHVLGRIEEYSKSGMYGSIESMRSLDSIASSLSRLETQVATLATSPMSSIRERIEDVNAESKRYDTQQQRQRVSSANASKTAGFGSLRTRSFSRFTSNPWKDWSTGERRSWSCVEIVGHYDAAFHPSTIDGSSENSGHITPRAASAADICGYCGEVFTNFPDPDWSARISHLIHTHNFGECDEVYFTSIEEFRLHLKSDHDGTHGQWSIALENVCIQEEPSSAPSIQSGEANSFEDYLQEIQRSTVEMYPPLIA